VKTLDQFAGRTTFGGLPSIPHDWRVGRRLGAAVLFVTLPLADLDAAETVQALRPALVPLAVRQRLPDIDLSAVTGPQRELTQAHDHKFGTVCAPGSRPDRPRQTCEHLLRRRRCISVAGATRRDSHGTPGYTAYPGSSMSGSVGPFSRSGHHIPPPLPSWPGGAPRRYTEEALRIALLRALWCLSPRAMSDWLRLVGSRRLHALGAQSTTAVEASGTRAQTQVGVFMERKERVVEAL